MLLSPAAAEDGEIGDFLQRKLERCLVQKGDAAPFALEESRRRLAEQYPGTGLETLGLEGDAGAVRALGGLLDYVHATQKNDMRYLNPPEILATGRFMELDYATRKNLELTEGLRSGEKRGSLLWVLDRTCTPMGARLLRSWVERPLLTPVPINRRLDAVEELYRDNVLRGELRAVLRDIGDCRRLVGRAVYGTANARDLLALGSYCAASPSSRPFWKRPAAPPSGRSGGWTSWRT